MHQNRVDCRYFVSFLKYIKKPITNYQSQQHIVKRHTVTLEQQQELQPITQQSKTLKLTFLRQRNKIWLIIASLFTLHELFWQIYFYILSVLIPLFF